MNRQFLAQKCSNNVSVARQEQQQENENENKCEGIEMRVTTTSRGRPFILVLGPSLVSCRWKNFN